MRTIINLDDYREIWTAEYLECEYCAYRWVGVIPSDIVRVECPNCSGMTLIRYAEYLDRITIESNSESSWLKIPLENEYTYNIFKEKFMGEKIGIENLKLLISLPIELGNIADAIGRDSKSGWKRYLKLVDCLDEVLDAVKVNYSELESELRDLDDVEKAELQKYIAEKFDIADENLESVIERSLVILQNIGSLVVESIALFKTVKK